jgi:hypothetical protein
MKNNPHLQRESRENIYAWIRHDIIRYRGLYLNSLKNKAFLRNYYYYDKSSSGPFPFTFKWPKFFLQWYLEDGMSKNVREQFPNNERCY